MYLQERVLAEHPDSLLASFLSVGTLADTAFFWEQPFIDTLPDPLQQAVAHARNFSKALHGAAPVSYTHLDVYKRQAHNAHRIVLKGESMRKLLNQP